MDTLSLRLNNVCLQYLPTLIESGMKSDQARSLLETLCADVVRALSKESTEIDTDLVYRKTKELPEDRSYEWTFKEVRAQGSIIGAEFTHSRLAAVYEAKLKALDDSAKNLIEGISFIKDHPEMDVPALAGLLLESHGRLTTDIKKADSIEALESKDCPYSDQHKTGVECIVCGASL